MFEVHFAVLNGVRMKLCAYISPDDLKHGRVHADSCVHWSKFSVDSSAAICGIPGHPQSADEIMIRKKIDKSVIGFEEIDQSVEYMRLSYLANYPINDVEWYGDKSGAIRKIKEAIEYIIPRVNLRNDLKTYDQYCLSEKLNDDEDKNFEAWSKYIQDKLA